nr:hypothetical protein [Bacillus pumilus]
MEKNILYSFSHTAVFLLLIYAIYVVISLRFFMQAGENEPVALYLQFVKMSLLLLGAGIVLSRNKLKRQEYQFYFLNSAIQSVPFILCVYFFPVLFCFLMAGLLFLPIVLGLLITGVTPSLYWIIVVCITCRILALYTLASWICARIGVSHFVSKTKEHFFASNDRLWGASCTNISPFSKSGGDDPCMAKLSICCYLSSS